MATPTTRETKEAPGGPAPMSEPPRTVVPRTQFDALRALVIELAARPDKTLIMHYSAVDILPATLDAFEVVTRAAGRRYIRMQQCRDCVLFIIYPIDTTEETAVEVENGGSVVAGDATGRVPLRSEDVPNVVTDADLQGVERRVVGIFNALERDRSWSNSAGSQ